jgi:hypothetical protein
MDLSSPPCKSPIRPATQHHPGSCPHECPCQHDPAVRHSPLFPLGQDTAPYRNITSEGARVEKVIVEEVDDDDREALRALAEAAFAA